MSYSKRHNKFLFLPLAEFIYGSFRKAENEISNVVNYHPNTLGRAAQGLTAKRVLLNFISGHWQVCRIFEKQGLDFANQKEKRGMFYG